MGSTVEPPSLPVAPELAACAYAPEDPDEFGDSLLDRDAGFEYLDHTADVQIHSWGPTLAATYSQAVVAMFNYMTDLRAVHVVRSCDRPFAVQGRPVRVSTGSALTDRTARRHRCSLFALSVYE